MSRQLFLIWSIEKKGWYWYGEKGYTKYREKAGAYRYLDALQIVKEANKDRGDVPVAAMIGFHDREPNENK